jgi:diphthine-ammonia ligase
MKLVGLFSGGKDSTYAIYKAIQDGHKVHFLGTVMSDNTESYMYHTDNIGMTMLLSQTLGMKLATKRSFGEKEKEVEDLKILIKGLEVEGVVCGAIESEYQRDRVAKVCEELKIELVAPLWHIDVEKYLRDMVKEGFKVIIVGVAADGLDESWLGREIDDKCIDDLLKVKEKHKIHIAGEGGEFETIVLDCPLYQSRVEITDSEKKWDGASGSLIIKDAKLIPKN